MPLMKNRRKTIIPQSFTNCDKPFIHQRRQKPVNDCIINTIIIQTANKYIYYAKLQIMTQFQQLLNEAFDEESETFQTIRRHFYSLMLFDINTIDPIRFTFDLHATFKTRNFCTRSIFKSGCHYDGCYQYV
jgi:hypothetical protein